MCGPLYRVPTGVCGGSSSICLRTVSYVFTVRILRCTWYRFLSEVLHSSFRIPQPSGIKGSLHSPGTLEYSVCSALDAPDTVKYPVKRGAGTQNVASYEYCTEDSSPSEDSILQALNYSTTQCFRRLLLQVL